MEDLTPERYLGSPELRAALEAAARRERAKYVKRFMAQSAAALLGAPKRDTPVKSPCPEPCA